jgi:hypothetical protein
MCGKGKYQKPDLTVYEGEWKNRKKNGYGVITYSDGFTYKGFWKDNNKHGKGVVHFENEDEYEGEVY